MHDSARQLRLGLVGFSDAESAQLLAALVRLHDVCAHWRVVETLPFDALLLARGSRQGDPQDLAVLRLLRGAPAARDAADLDRRRSMIWLSKPIADDALRAALLAAREQLRAAS